MEHTYKAISFLFLLFLTPISAQQNQFVKVEGKKFIKPNGETLLLKGINLGNWLNPEGYMFHFKNANSARLINDVFTELLGPEETKSFWRSFRENYITQEDIKFIKKIGLNSIRVPFNFRLFCTEEYPAIYNDEGFQYLDSLISWCSKVGLLVILDMHAAPGGQTGDNIDDSWGYPFLYDSEAMQNLTAELWQKIASRYKNETTVLGYDLLNEPIPHFFDQNYFNPKLEPLYKKIVSAIRQVDTNHIIFLGGAQWDTNFKVFNEPFDKKLAYTFHKYWMPIQQKEIQEYINFRDKYNVPIWLGESGENKDEWISSFRELLEKNSIGWCFWPYKKMDSQSSIVSFSRTKEWDEIIKYANSLRNNFEAVRKNRPSNQIIKKAFNDLLENIKLKNCKINNSYINALGCKFKNHP
ncbi:glycoside hydrolase family 5 protein [Melioribacteraceae bacterium 4301-Me]|uniref:glycoside hydrolase family 5 protein n=1 Tax=Pyranulibacter aquaticus TaxID=3163344 RepID=UPI003599C24A